MSTQNQRGSGIGAIIGGIIGYIIAGPSYILIGMSIGAMIGGLLYPPEAETDTPEVAEFPIYTAQFGALIPIIYGKYLVAGNCLWYGNFQSHLHKETVEQDNALYGTNEYEYEYYTYSLSIVFAVAYGGTISKIWANNVPVSASAYTEYDGTQTSTDAHWAWCLTQEGYTRHPVNKGVSYVVINGYDMGRSPNVPNFTFEITRTHPDNGAIYGWRPDQIVKDVITNPMYSIALPESVLDTAALARVADTCVDEEFYLSFKFIDRMKVLDVLSYISSHHAGLVYARNEKIVYDQFGVLPPVASINYTLMRETLNEPYVIVSMEGHNKTKNMVSLEYTDPERNYQASMAQAMDVHQANVHGIQQFAIALKGIDNYNMASKISNYYLRVIGGTLKTIKFSMPISLSVINVGDLINFTDIQTSIQDEAYHVLKMTELPDSIEVEAVESKINTFNFVITSNPDKYPTNLAELNVQPEKIPSLMVLELPAIYNNTTYNIGQVGVYFSVPEQDAWGSGKITQSFYNTLNFNSLGYSSSANAFGTITNVGDDEITVVLDTSLGSAVIESAVDFDTLITTHVKNLVVTSTGVFLKYEVAELLAENTWKISGFIYDLVEKPTLRSTGNLQVDDVLIFNAYVPSYKKGINSSDLYKLSYYEVVSRNVFGSESYEAPIKQDSVTTVNHYEKPLVPYNISVNSIGGSEVEVPDADITFSWVSRNRIGGRIIDATTTTAYSDDSEFNQFDIKISTINDILINEHSSTSKSWTYTSALQTADGVDSSFKVSVRQVNNTIHSDYSQIVTITKT